MIKSLSIKQIASNLDFASNFPRLASSFLLCFEHQFLFFSAMLITSRPNKQLTGEGNQQLTDWPEI